MKTMVTHAYAFQQHVNGVGYRGKNACTHGQTDLNVSHMHILVSQIQRETNLLRFVSVFMQGQKCKNLARNSSA